MILFDLKWLYHCDFKELEEKKLHRVVDHQLAAQQALDNPGDDLCEKNARLIK